MPESSLTESESEEPFAAASPYQASSDDDDEEEDDEAAEAEGEEVEGEGDEESPRVYRNVPTWEEAIGFLLHRQPGDSHSREGRSGGPRDHRRGGGRRSGPGERQPD
ncbi:MAG TPA: hypothetical protein VHX68_06135 [Planctomycetaceae bacterium]|nr:hypothetical protein [Planctomycetaceae bacterium]